MQTGIRFRCYPPQPLAHSLHQWIGCQRHIFNAKVGEDRYFRAFARKSLSHTGQFAPIDQQYAHFKTELTPWLKEVPSVVLRNGAVKWKQAYSRFFQKLSGRPVIQKKHGKQSVWLTSELFEFKEAVDPKTGIATHQLHLGTKKHCLGNLPFKAHRAFKLPASIHISVHAGKWLLSFSYDDGIAQPSEAEVKAWLMQHSEAELMGMTVGIDRGIAIPFACSSGQDLDFSGIQKHRIAKQERYKKRWQKIQARRKDGSNRKRKAKARVAAYSRYAADVRRDFAHKASCTIASNPQHRLFAIEDLKVKNMTASAKGAVEAPGKNVRQKAGLNRSILASAWGQTKTYLQYKARKRGKLCIAVPPHYSSQECAQCGHTHQDNRTSQSVFVCQRCDHTDNADRNAARVIAKRGVRLLLSGKSVRKEKKRCAITRTKVGAECSEPAGAIPPTLVEIKVSRSSSNAAPLWSLIRETPATRPQGL